MKAESFDGSRERKVLAGLVTCDAMLAKIAASWKPDFFASRWANLVGGWCVEHVRKHGKAPHRGVVSLFERWAERNKRDQATVDSVEQFLAGLSAEHERNGEQNAELLLDLAGEHRDWVAFNRLTEIIRQGQEAGHLERVKEKAAEIVGGLSRDVGLGNVSDYYADKDFSHLNLEAKRSVVEYPGDLGRFFRRILVPGSFVAFLAPIKSKKSFFLLDVALRASWQRKRVAYFDVGDMTRDQVYTRADIRLARNPLWAERWPLELEVPVEVKPPRTNRYTGVHDFVPATPVFKTLVIDGPLTQEKIERARAKTLRKKMRTGKTDYLKVACWPNSSINVAGIQAELQRWKLADGWTPDLCVIDYADILDDEPGTGRLEDRNKVNATWKALRAMSQKLHCLVLTGTQGNKESYNRVWLDRTHFSDDKRKLAHAEVIVGLNITNQDRERNIIRLNVVAGRDSDHHPAKGIHVAGHPALSNVAMCSTFSRKEAD